ncbi:ATP-dependent RNA helicase, partial [Rhizopus stolonifer]
RIKKADRKKGKKAEPTAPLTVEETGKYFDLDTFDEELATQQKEQQSEEQPLEQQSEEHQEVEAKENTQEEPKKTKAQKLLEKKKKELEKLMNQVEQLEAEAKDTTDTNKDKPRDSNKPLNKRERLAAKRKAQEEQEEEEQEEEKKKLKPSRPTVDDIDPSVDISAWKDLHLAEPIQNALKYNQFTSPTPIQKNALPLAMQGRDIIGSAETGSGKTLAFGLPIIHYLASHGARRGLCGLILTPTRELAIQVRDHIEKMSVFTDLRVVAIVGGMSIQKQERLMKQNPDIIVATPGRLWEIFSNNTHYMDMLKHIKFLVLDEADRMLEKGHFEELSKLLNSLSKKRQDTTEWPEHVGQDATKQTLARDMGVHQTFIYTATLTKDIRFNVKAKKKKLPVKQTNSLEDLLERIEFADPEPALVDMTSDSVVASQLLEAKIDCVNTEKDLYVYYFVTRYPGRTIVFVNSIDAIRRLVPVFKLLNVEVLGLHAQMQQKQRLKSLDRFKNNPKAVLVASDVAARGLDIPLVDHVIHYQLPRSGEIYVHRSGRTARANREGISLLLCGPEEIKIYQKLCQTLRKNQDYPNFPVDMSILRAMTERVKLAAQIDSIQHQESKQAHEVNWMKNMAQEMDVEFDEETMQGKGHNKSQEELQKQKTKAAKLKHQLAGLLKQPILPAGVSPKFLTGGIVSDLAERLMKNTNHELLPGTLDTKAIEDLGSVKKKKD